jgi:chromosome segregation ATPase
MTIPRLIFVLFAIAVTAGPVVLAQTAAVDPLRELLTEVRALRLAMERAEVNGTRVQLLVARIQLQEQRIAELSRRSAAVRTELRQTESESSSITAEAQRMEAILRDAKASPEEREQIDRMSGAMKTQIETIERRRQELANDDAFLNQQLTLEQGRWNEINERLDQLERSLPVK